MERHNMGLEHWKETWKKIGITYGEERNPYMSEVEYRKRVVDCISRMLKTRNETIVSGTRGETSRSRSCSGPYSGGARSEVAQSSIVVASSGSGMRQCWERFEVGVPIGVGVGVGQGVAALVIHAIARAASAAAGGGGSGNLGET